MKKTTKAYGILFFCISVVSFAQTKQDALVLYKLGQYSQAIEVCLAEIEEMPRNIDSYVVLSWALVAAEQYNEANSWAEKGRTIARYDPRLIEIQAEALYFIGNNEQALRLFQDYINNAPNGSRIANVYAFMGEIYLRQSKFRHADISFSTAVELEKTRADWWTRLGYAREMAQEYQGSITAYDQALILDSDLQDAKRGRTRVISRM